MKNGFNVRVGEAKKNDRKLHGLTQCPIPVNLLACFAICRLFFFPCVNRMDGHVNGRLEHS